MSIITEETLPRYLESLASGNSAIKIPPKNEILYTRNKIPERFRSPQEKKDWEKQEKTRLVYGHDGMSGKMYGFFNYGSVIKDDGGFSNPQYRVFQNQWYKLVSTVKKYNQGAVCVKKRQAGLSSMELYDALHDTFLNPQAVVGMNSKNKTDSEAFVTKMKMVFSRLPEFHRHPVISDTNEGFFFGEKKGSLYSGIQSRFFCRPPTDSCYESETPYKIIMDEAGKTPNCQQIFSYAEPGLYQGTTVMVGCPLIFGTSGDIGSTGGGLKNFWYKHKQYHLRQFFVAGWMGIPECTDKYGNTDWRAAIQWIMERRAEKQGISQKDYTDFVQQFPLTPEEAFAQYSEGAGWDISRVLSHKANLESQPPRGKVGYFKKEGGKVVFHPQQFNAKGQENMVTLWHHPEAGVTYLSGTDPISRDNVKRSQVVSHYCAYWHKAPQGLQPEQQVARVKGRPDNLDEIFMQSLLCDEFFNNSRNMMEDNDGERVITFYKANNGFKNLAFRPNPASHLMGAPQTLIGFKKTTGSILVKMNSETVSMIEEQCEVIEDVDLCTELTDFNMGNKDCLSAWQSYLLNRADYMANKFTKINSSNTEGFTMTFKRVRNINGKIVVQRAK